MTGPDGQRVLVSSVTAVAGFKSMRDLTVADVHTYYVIVGETSILVHNIDIGQPNSVDDPLLWFPFRDDTVSMEPQASVDTKYWIREGGKSLQRGSYTYVVMPNWSVRAYHTKTVEDLFPYGAPLLPGHTSLAHSGPVIAAGTFDINEHGEIIEWTNWSGHYAPTNSKALKQIARKGLEANGFTFASGAKWVRWC